VTQTSKDVERLVDEQEPDSSKPCPHCHKPVRDPNIFVEGDVPRLLSHCGGSGSAYSGEGCFATVAWHPEKQQWEPY
jgi:hypothetical protein